MVPDDYQKCAADMNGDGNVRSNDATLILRKAAGLVAPIRDAITKSNEFAKISLSNSYGIVGDKIAVQIKADEANIISSGDIHISYDPNILSPVEVSSDPETMIVSNISESGNIKISFANANVIKNSKLAEIYFNVLKDDISSLRLVYIDLYNCIGLPIKIQSINGEFRSWAIKPEHNALLQNYPNPFNPETWIPYQLKDDSQISIQIYSISGELVRKLDLGYKSAGIYSNRDRAAYWDGKNEVGEYVSSGIYFYTIKAGEFTSTRKMIIQK